jgi:hypothetical protein
LDLRKYYVRCDRCQQDEYTELAFAFLFTAIAFFAFVCINNILSYTPDPQVRPETTRLHALERAITRQIEINYHLSRLSLPLSHCDRTCNSDHSKQWAAQWFVIDRFRVQAEVDFKRGVPNWYYDNYPDFAAKRYHALTEELARLQSLGRNIVNAREEAINYCGNAAGEEEMTAISSEGLVREQQINELGIWKRSRPRKLQDSQGRATFQQQVDTIGRLTPGGRVG